MVQPSIGLDNAMANLWSSAHSHFQMQLGWEEAAADGIRFEMETIMIELLSVNCDVSDQLH